MTTGWVGNSNARLRAIRWLLIPVSLLLFALVGMAISTEQRDDFQDRSSVVAGQPQPGSGRGEPVPVGAATTAPPTTGEQDTTTTAGQDQQGEEGQDGSGDDGGQQVSFEITGGTGRLAVQLTGERLLAVPAGLDATGAPALLASGPDGPAALDPTAPDATPPDTPGTGPDGEAAGGLDQAPIGLRLVADGQLEPVTQSQIVPGDLVVAPTGGGLDLLRADGSRVQIRPDASPGGVGASELSATGVTPLQPDSSGEIEVGDGLMVRLPSSGPVDIDQPSAWARLNSSRWRWVILAAAAGLVALAVAVVVVRRRRHQEAEEGFGSFWVASSGVPAHRFEAFLAMLSADPDPARAIRLAFAAAERGLGDLPRRESTDTPFEWYRRVAADRPDLAEPLAGLCACFANTRFAPAVPTPADRDSAVAELWRLHQASGGSDPGGHPSSRRSEVGAGV